MIPVVLVQIPPLVDYPNHMARMHILADTGRSPWLTQNYEIHWNILPNLAMDLVVPPLTRFMSLETAGKVFIGLTFALLAGGTMALHAALHRRWAPWPLLAFFFLYNSVFLWGFLSYLFGFGFGFGFGLGLALITCALWIVLRDRPAALIVPLFSLLAVIRFFAHLLAFGIFTMFVLAYEFAQWWGHHFASARAFTIPLWKAVPTIVMPLLLLILSPTFRASPDNHPAWLRGAASLPALTFTPLNTRLEALRGTIRTEHQLLDRLTGLALIGLVGVGLALQRCTVVPSMYLPLGIVALAALAMPSTIGTTGFVDIRMPIVFLLLAIASLNWPVTSRRWLMPLALMLAHYS